jgi:alpha-pyrone synthase
MHSAITAIGVSNPPYKRNQLEIAELISEGFYLTPSQKKIVKRIYQASGIEQRYSVLSDYVRAPGAFEFFPNDPSTPFPTTAERMAIYKANALNLALAAITQCFASLPSFDKKEITHLITVSCTGMYAPGIDIEIVQALTLQSSVKRTSINFMGCYGAFNALKLGDAICRAEPAANVLVVCVELCSIHIQKDFSLNNIVANALFADGAAAVLIQRPQKQQRCFQLESFYCDLVPQTSQEMAWKISDHGFEMILTAYVPEVIQLGIAAFAQKSLAQTHRSLGDIDYYAIHPGGLKILQACESSLSMTQEDNRFSYEVLREHGNMSSATVLFVLQRIWDRVNQNEQDKKIFSCAFGPGLTLESMLLTIVV